MNATSEAPRKLKPWEYRAAKPKTEVSGSLTGVQVAELLMRHHLGYMDAKAHQRLSELFMEEPADIRQRLERACEHLKVTGANAETYALAVNHQKMMERLEARVGTGTWLIPSADVLKEYLVRASLGEVKALLAVVEYVMLSEVTDALKAA